MKAAVLGAAGYAGGELLRLLLTHPRIQSVQAISRSQAGAPCHSVHADLQWLAPQLCFEDNVASADIVFLAGGHGEARTLLATHSIGEARLIDLSQDFRDESEGFVYGLSEIARSRLREARRVANPGCFATALQLALAPLAAAGFLKHEIHATALTGATGAGQSLQRSTQLAERQQNLSVYKAFGHQHLTEIRQSLSRWPFALPALHFVPMRAPFARGILASVYTKTDAPDALTLFQDFYRDSPFVAVTGQEISLKPVVNTNNAWLSVQRYDEQLHIVTCIDNLLKGAAGQAVQNMNLMLGWPETEGLHLKPIVY